MRRSNSTKDSEFKDAEQTQRAKPAVLVPEGDRDADGERTRKTGFRTLQSTL